MSTTQGPTPPRRLRPADEEDPRADRGAIGEAIAACLAEAPAGVAAPALAGRVALRLGLAPEQVSRDDLDAALGTLVVTGRVDEAEGRLILVGEERRQVG